MLQIRGHVTKFYYISRHLIASLNGGFFAVCITMTPNDPKHSKWALQAISKLEYLLPINYIPAICQSSIQNGCYII